ncbi:MAG: sensor histidine kinase [Thermodesulfobacteriota bacterium]
MRSPEFETTRESGNLPIDESIEWAILDDFCRNARPIVIASLGAVAVILAVAWNVADRRLLVGWTVLALVVTSLRVALVHRYYNRKRDAGELPFWSRALALSEAAAGLLWGLSALFLQAFEPLWIKVGTTFAFAALSAVAIAAYSGRRDVFYSFLLPATVPHGLALAHFNAEYDVAIIVLIIACLGLSGLMARKIRRQARAAKKFQIENRGLIARLMHAKDEAEAASRAKTRFLANMSHELRTPLNAIIGFAEMMSRKVLGPVTNPSYEAYVRSIYESGTHLLKVIDEVLDLSRLEAGRVELLDDAVNLDNLIAGTIEIMRGRAQMDGIHVKSSIEPGLPGVRGDSVKLRQVLLNLLSNALKFTPANGRVTISAARSIRGGLAIEVEDNGVGMSPEDLRRVVVPFARLEQREHTKRIRAHKRDTGQTSNGLGLPLVKMLVELHGGRFELESTLGRGTLARIILPAERLIGVHAGTKHRLVPA